MPARFRLVGVAGVEGNVVQKLLQRFPIGSASSFEALDAAPQEVDVRAASFRLWARVRVIPQHPDGAQQRGRGIREAPRAEPLPCRLDCAAQACGRSFGPRRERLDLIGILESAEKTHPMRLPVLHDVPKRLGAEAPRGRVHNSA